MNPCSPLDQAIKKLLQEKYKLDFSSKPSLNITIGKIALTFRNSDDDDFDGPTDTIRVKIIY